jgi:L-iditol 2-dehydrogenase
LAKALGAGRIIATDINDYRLRAAKEFGAEVVINAHDDVPARVREVNNGNPVDLVIICAGNLSVFKQALQSVDRGGTVLFFAPTDPGVELPVPVNDFWRNGITLLPSYGASPSDCVQAIELMRSGQVPVSQLITHRLGLEDTALGFKLVEEAKECIKVIIEPNRT